MKTCYMFVFLVAISTTTALADIECHYCGLKDQCTIPFDDSSSTKVTCAIGCLKFDGKSNYDPDENKRSLVRGCGEEDMTACEPNKEWFESKGTLCHCTTDLCNSSQKKISSNLHYFMGLLFNIVCWCLVMN
jgi:hypothetical protein